MEAKSAGAFSVLIVACTCMLSPFAACPSTWLHQNMTVLPAELPSGLQSHVFCGKCGSRTEPIEAGGKRQCLADPAHREYPRTDPVVYPGPLCSPPS